jgi:hypothetical protein
MNGPIVDSEALFGGDLVALRFPEGNRAEAETNGSAGALAKRNRGKMDRKLPPRDARTSSR